MYEISARIDEKANGSVGCFDPTKVILRIMNEIDGVIVCVHDYAWQNYDAFVARSAYEGAIRVAENDARRRGPIFTFRVRTGTKQTVQGSAERYIVRIWSNQQIPSSISASFLSLFHSLQLGQVSAHSVRITGNTVEVL